MVELHSYIVVIHHSSCWIFIEKAHSRFRQIKTKQQNNGCIKTGICSVQSISWKSSSLIATKDPKMMLAAKRTRSPHQISRWKPNCRMTYNTNTTAASCNAVLEKGSKIDRVSGVLKQLRTSWPPIYETSSFLLNRCSKYYIQVKTWWKLRCINAHTKKTQAN